MAPSVSDSASAKDTDSDMQVSIVWLEFTSQNDYFPAVLLDRGAERADAKLRYNDRRPAGDAG